MQSTERGYPPYRPAPWVPAVSPLSRPRPAPLRAKELIAAAGIVVACDLAVWGGDGVASGGFGMAAFFVVMPIVLIVAARAWRRSARLGAVSALLFAVAVRCAFQPTAGAVMSGLVLVVAFTLALRAPRMFVPEGLTSALSAFPKLPSRIGAALAGVRRMAARTRIGHVSLLPIVIPIGLCAAFAAIFALANPVVAHGLDLVWRAMSTVITVPSPLRVLLWLLSLTAACALLRPALRLAKGTETAMDVSEPTETSLRTTRNALGALNVLFLFYNALDAAYLWSGAPPAGMRTQQYAHQGAFWLTLALLMLTGVIGVMFRGSLAQATNGRLARRLAYVWMAQGLVLALGTYRRIAIHIANSGLSDLRIVGILGTTLVVAGVVAVAVKLHRRRTLAWLVRRQLDAFVVTVVLYTVAPTHFVSARVNVTRIERGEYRPLLHMFRQSTEAESAAQLVPLLHHADGRVRAGVAALLEAERQRLVADVHKQDTWRERNLATRSALASLDAAAPEIATVLGHADPDEARRTLLEVSRAANEAELTMTGETTTTRRPLDSRSGSD